MIGYGASGTTHDFFAYNAAGQVWNGATFVNWADGDYASYHITATPAGTSGRFAGTAPAGTMYYELRVRGASVALSYVVWAEASTNAATAATEARRTRQFDSNRRTIEVLSATQWRYTVYEDDATTVAYRVDYNPTTGAKTAVTP